MKKTSILIVLITLVISAYAQTEKIVGSWLMTKAETSKGVQKPYQITDFNEDGHMVMMGWEVGTWQYNKKNHSLVLKSDFDKDFNGEGKIEKITEKELVVLKDGVKMSYLKVDYNTVAENNEKSGLYGSWDFKDQSYPDLVLYVTFKAPDEFSIIEKEPGMQSESSGMWIFDSENRELLMIGLRGSDKFSGKNSLALLDEDNIELDNKGLVFKANRLKASTIKIERLAFTESDFYNEDGDYKYYDEEQKLPWLNWPEMKNDLLNVHQLVYNYSTLIEGTEAFNTKTLTADVKASLEEDGFNIDYIFDGFDRYTLPEDAELRFNGEYSYPLYPLEDDTFRVVGQEQITTPAGTFDCTVVEAFSDSRTAKKLWMINDKIGVYAKIIEDNSDENFGHYAVYELQEIINK